MSQIAKSEAEIRAWKMLSNTQGMKQIWTNWDLVISFALGNVCGFILTLICFWVN